MKYLPTLLTLATLSISPTLLAGEADTAPTTNTTSVIAEENNNSALTELCNTYAKEDGLTESKKAAYLKECMSNMTDLSENMQEDLPVTSAETGEVLATPASEHLNSSPEKLVQNELVESPDPAAEQLTAEK